MDEFDFDIIPAEKESFVRPNPLAEAEKKLPQPQKPNTVQKLGNAVADNFPQILDLANKIADIWQKKADTEEMVEKMRGYTEQYRAETERYIKELQKQNEGTVSRIDALTRMIKEINSSPNNNIPPEQLSELLKIAIGEDKK